MARKRAAIQGLRDTDSNTGVLLGFDDAGDGSTNLSVLPGTAPGASASVVDGTLTTSTTAAPLQAAGSSTAIAEVLIANTDATNSVTVTGPGIEPKTLIPGQRAWFVAINTALVQVAAVSGTPVVAWCARAALGGRVAATTTATALTAQVCTDVLLVTDPANAANVLVGGSDSQGVPLVPGNRELFPVNSANLLYVKMASGTGNVYWQARSANLPVYLASALQQASDGVDTIHYGTPGAGNNVSVATSSTAVLSANASRKGVVFTNVGANAITIDLSGGTAVLNKGVVLTANGVPWSPPANYVPTSAITAIAATGATTLAYQELL